MNKLLLLLSMVVVSFNSYADKECNLVPGTPIGITYTTSGANYVLTTVAAFGFRYVWDISNGSIVGPQTQNQVVVAPDDGACSFSVTVHAISTCNNAGPSISASFTVPSISFIGNIAGPQSVGTSYGDFSTYSVYPGGGPKEFVWSLTGPFTLSANGGSTATAFVNTHVGYGSGNLYVYARNSCSQTSVASKYITVGNGYPTSGRTGWQTITDPVLISAQGAQKLIVPYFEDVEKIIIYNMSGEVVESLTPQDVEVTMEGLSNDIYVVKTIRSNGNTTTTKTRINH